MNPWLGLLFILIINSANIRAFSMHATFLRIRSAVFTFLTCLFLAPIALTTRNKLALGLLRCRTGFLSPLLFRNDVENTATARRG